MTASRNTAFGSITQRPADTFPAPKLQPLDPAPLATTGPGAQGEPWQTPAGPAPVPGAGNSIGPITDAQAQSASLAGESAGEVRTLSDGANAGVRVRWFQPTGAGSPVWCWDIYPQTQYQG